MKKLLFPILVLALAVSSCGEKEDPYALEQKEIDAYFVEGGLDYYQAFKISLRGTKAVGKDPEFDSARMQLLLLTGYAMEAIHDSEISVSKYIRAGTEIYNAETAVEVLLEKDEDSLPTVMENISFVMVGDSVPDPLANLFTESEEHLILAGLWFAGAHAHPDLAMYELNRIKINDIRDPQFRLLTEMTRSLLYLTHEWPYHAEKSADDFLAMTETEKDALLATPWPGVDVNGNTVSPEQAWHQIRAIGYVLRAAARSKCEDDEEKNEAAFDDLDEFVKEAEAGGLDHEVVDLAGLTVALKHENNDDALMYIEKLEKRQNLTAEEKELIAEIKTYVSDKKHEDAETALEENGAMPGFLGNLFADQFMNLPAVKKLEESETGKKFIEVTHIDIASAISNEIDSLEKDTKGIIDSLF